MLTTTHAHLHPRLGMTSIRAFIISSSMFLTAWLAVSYATHLEKNKPQPAVQQPATAAGATNNTLTGQSQHKEPITVFR